MIEENNDIFLVGSDALVYLVGPMHKKDSKTFIWSHPFSTHISYNWFSTTAIALSNSHSNNNSIEQAL